MTSNYSFYSIPAYWIIALSPHAFSVGLIKKNNNKRWNNPNPRGIDTYASYQKSVPADVFGTFERARAAHQNALENAPFFIGAVLAGNYAGLSASTLNTVTSLCLALRLAHILLYVNITGAKTSFVRTAVFAASSFLVMGLYVAAGNKLRAG